MRRMARSILVSHPISIAVIMNTKMLYVKASQKKYALKLLVHVETYDSVTDAIAREKQLKAWRRDWKIDLVNTSNPDWKNIDLV